MHIVKSREQLLSLNPKELSEMIIPITEILHWFSLLDAHWSHSGDPKDPHAELTSGWCSNGFFDCLRVLKYVNLSQILADQLAMKLITHDRWIGTPDWVIGSPMAGITFAHDVARSLGVLINMCVEKDPEDPKKKRMLWNRMQIPQNDWVLQIEELTTTSQTLNEVQKAIFEGNGGTVNFVPMVGILVHRPPKLPVYQYGIREVVALIEKEVWAVPPEECPLCKDGSKRYRPKSHWKELTGKA